MKRIRPVDISSPAKKSGFWLFLGVFLLYFLPWQGWFEAGDGPIQARLVLDLLRAGIGLALFLAPGGFLYLLLMPRARIYSWVAIGFNLSYLLVAVLGLIGRAAHFPFAFVKYGFVVIGGVSGLAFFLSRGEGRGNVNESQEYLWSALLIIPVVCCALIGLRPTFTFDNGDDLTYLAYLTRWQHSDMLGFQEILYGTHNLDPVRFWVSLMPMGWALLAELTKLHGLLLLGGYLQFLLPAISLAGMYELARALKLPVRAALLAVFIQVVFYMVLFDPNLQVGVIFFTNLDQDKAVAAFMLAPALFLAVVNYLEQRTTTGLTLFFLAGMSLSLAHPIILTYSLVIVGIYCVFDLLPGRGFRELGVLFLLSIMLLSPHVYLRFSEHESEAARTYTLEESSDAEGFYDTVTVIPGTPFYGFDPGVLQIRRILDWGNAGNGLLQRSLLFALAVAMFAAGLFRFRESPAARFILAGLLFVSLAGIPFTGWLLGYFVTPRMLWRAPWLFPFGIGSVLLVESVLGFFEGRLLRRPAGNALAVTGISALLGMFALAVVFITVPGRAETLGTYTVELTRVVHLAQAGQAMDRSVSGAAVGAAPEPYNSTLPGLTSRLNIVLFRGNSGVTMNYFLGEKEKLTRKRALRDIFSVDAAVSRKIEILLAYDIEYLFYPAEYEDDFALRAQYPACFDAVVQVSELMVYRVRADCLESVRRTAAPY